MSEQATSVSTPVVADSGIPFVIGTAPVQSAESPASAGTPVLCTSWDEAVEKLGYSDNWESYQLCEFMILSLSNSGDLLTRTVNTANTAWSENTALTAEAEKRYGTTASKVTMWSGKYIINQAKHSIGSSGYSTQLKLRCVLEGY